MKKAAIIFGLFLMTTSSVYGQRAKYLKTSDDSAKISIQLMLNPSFQPITKTVKPLKVEYLFENKISTFHHYLNVFNSVMATFVLAEASDNIDLNDYYLRDPLFYNPRTAFQYNFMKKRTQLYYISDLQKEKW